MTETTVERKFIDGLSDTVSNFALERVLYENYRELGVPSYTEEELAYADQLAATYPGSDKVPGVAAANDREAFEAVKDMQKAFGHKMNGFLAPLYQKDAFQPGSTDVGDVSWLTPTAQIHVAAWPNGCPGHSWQNVSCDRTEIGHKAAVHAGKVLAAAAIDLMNHEELLKEDGIYSRIWNEPAYSAENTVMVHIRRIREKIELNPSEPEYLKVVWGIGYEIEKH